MDCEEAAHSTWAEEPAAVLAGAGAPVKRPWKRARAQHNNCRRGAGSIPARPASSCADPYITPVSSCLTWISSSRGLVSS